MNLNRVIIIGRIASEVDHRILEESNSNLARFLLAVNKKRRFSNSGVESSNFIPVVTWRQNADFVMKYLSKGSLIALEGYINVSRYTSKTSGNIVERFEVVGEVIESLEPRSINEVRRVAQNKEKQDSRMVEPMGESKKKSSMEEIVEELNLIPSTLEESIPERRQTANATQNFQSNKADFRRFGGSSESFIESLRVQSREIEQRTDTTGGRRTPQENSAPQSSQSKLNRPTLISEEIISPGRKDRKIKGIIDSIWNEEQD